MIIENDNDRLILLAAFRYALGLKTYTPRVVVNEIKRQWINLSDDDRHMIHMEIQDAIDRGCAGMDMDVSAWKEILYLC